MKRNLIRLLQSAAFAVFAGIAIYGIMIFQGGERSRILPFWESILLGLGAVAAAVVILVLGGMQDRIAEEEERAEREMSETTGRRGG